MKKVASSISVVLLFAFCLLSTLYTSAQTLSPRATPSCGGYFTGNGKSLSWTLGEPFHTSLQSGNNRLGQGFQQPYILVRILNLKTFIQGFYLGSGLMQPVLFTTGESTDPTACDSITVELHETTFPNALVATGKGLLHTDGSAEVIFPPAFKNNPYYLVVRHRNALETWRKNAVFFNSHSMSFDFTKP